MDGNGDFQAGFICFYVMIWFIIQLKQPLTKMAMALGYQVGIIVTSSTLIPPGTRKPTIFLMNGSGETTIF